MNSYFKSLILGPGMIVVAVLIFIVLVGNIIAHLAYLDNLPHQSTKDKCSSIGMLYQSDVGAPGYKLCYGVNPEGKLIYKEIK